MPTCRPSCATRCSKALLDAEPSHARGQGDPAAEPRHALHPDHARELQGHRGRGPQRRADLSRGRRDARARRRLAARHPAARGRRAPALQPLDLQRRRRRAGGGDRPLGRRQDHAAAGAGLRAAAAGGPRCSWTGRTPGRCRGASCSGCAAGCSWRRRCRRCRRASAWSRRCWPAGCRRWACWPACARCSIRTTSRRPTTRCERFDLADKLFERVDRLSGGERQRVGLARALLAPASAVAGGRAAVGAGPDARAAGAGHAGAAGARTRRHAGGHAAPGGRGAGALSAHRRPARRRSWRSTCRRPRSAASGWRALYAQHEDELHGDAAAPPTSRATPPRRAGGDALPLSDSAAPPPPPHAAPARAARRATRPGSAACSGPVPALVLLWPLLVATEFKPWVLFEAANLKVTGQFLGQLPAAGAFGRVPGHGRARNLAHRGHRHRRHDAGAAAGACR